MSDDKPDITKLSEQFLDLWQRQLSATMKNPETVGSMMQMMHNMQQNMGTFANVTKTSTTDTDLSASRDDELRKLNSRIRELEQRIDKLESGTKD